MGPRRPLRRSITPGTLHDLSNQFPFRTKSETVCMDSHVHADRQGGQPE